MKSVLEKPAPKKAAQCQTPFPASDGKGYPGFLGNQLWSTPPSYPSRERCWNEVLPAERQEGLKLIQEFRVQEKIAIDNDVGAKSQQLELSEMSKIGGKNPLRERELRREIEACDYPACIAAHGRLNELRAQAVDLSKVILTRLVISFDEELNTVAIEAEARLEAIGVPICNQTYDPHSADKIGDYELWHQTECLWRHAWREVCRHKLAQFEHSANDIAIGTVQFLCSNEIGIPFQWL